MGSLKDTILHGFHGVVGIPDTESFEHTYFNAVAAVAGVFGLLLGSINIALGVGPIALAVVGFGVLMLGVYYLSRYRNIHHPLRWPVIALYLGLLAAYWVLTGGTQGGTQYYFFVGGLVSLFLVQGTTRKAVIVLLYLLTSAGLLYIEAAHPQFIAESPTKDSSFNYLFFSFMISQLTLYFMLIIISSNFEESLKTLGKYHNTFEEDLVLARAVQQQVLQYSPEITEGLDFDLVHRPSSELSGDLYDLSRPDPTYLRVLLADARGHGINASLISMLIKSEYVNVNNRSLSPGLLMNRLNQRIFERYDETLSLSAIIVDIYPNRMVYSSGGHVPQYLVADGKVTELDADGPPLGLFKDAEYPENEYKFSDDDRLVLFTDALIEELDMSGQPIGESWLQALVRRPLGAKDHTKRILERLADLKGQTVEKLDCLDDLTLIVIGSRPNAS